jgi:cell wall-associated NlpC family hydrolase
MRKSTLSSPLLIATGLMVLILLSAGCAPTKVQVPNYSRPKQTVSSHKKKPKAAAVISTSRSLIGTPYQWGGHSPETGFDCSGFSWYVFSKNGINLPRMTSQQFKTGKAVQKANIRAGDLVFFKVSKKKKSLHVGIVSEDSSFIHSPSFGKSVMESSMSNPFWRSHYLGARRIF